MPSTDSGDLSGDDADYGLLSPVWAGTPVTAVTSDRAVLAAMVRFEATLAKVAAPHGIDKQIMAAGVGIDPAAIARAARAGGNPVIPLLAALRENLDKDASEWLHRGATSQDALDTALALIAKDAARIIVADATAAVESFAEHAEKHRATVMVGRTITQPATPITAGLKIAGWARGVAAATAAVREAADAFPVQLGGAAGTLAAMTASGADSIDIAARLADELGLAEPTAPWHVWRSPITRLGDALVELTDAFGTVGENTTGLARIDEMDDGASGGSSTMPHKSNPIRAVLLNAATRQATHLLSSLHTASITIDERPDGAWHAEWEPFRSLLRVAGGSAFIGRELAAGLRVNTEVIARHVAESASDLTAERVRFVKGDVDPSEYLGVTDEFITRLLTEARKDLA